MRWFNESYARQSEKNGPIRITRWFGRWIVHHGEFEYTSSYLHDMWKQAILKLFTRDEKDKIHNILMLGLAAGGEIKTLNKIFPNCKLTAVEYDSEMVVIAKELKLYEPYPFPRTIVEDAATAVPGLKGELFDFIIVDMFSGPTPSALSQDEAFVRSLDGLLAKDGYLLVNIFRENKSYLETMSRVFENKQFWVYKQNLLGFFSKRHGSV